jgi:hypothetical protein
LTVDVIPYHPARQENEASLTSRLTLHHLVDSRLGHVLPIFAPNNSDARQPEDTSEWPPAIILDLFYGSAALQAWGPLPKDAYYHIGPDDADPHISPQVDARKARPDARNIKKAQAARFPEEIQFSSMIDGVMGLWMRSAREHRGN